MIGDALDESYIGVHVGEIRPMPRKQAEEFLNKTFIEYNKVYWCVLNGRRIWKREADLEMLG